MKKLYIKLSIIAMVATLFVACDKEYTAPTEEPNHNMVESSIKSNGNIMQVNGSFYLYDFSRGVEERAWEFPAGTTTLDGSEMLTSSEKRVDVIFTEPGEKVIKLSHVFNGDVYKDDAFLGTNEAEMEITFTVMDSVRADFKAARVLDNSMLNNANGALNQVQAGREVLYTDLSTGEPGSLRWIFKRADGFMREFAGDAETGEATAKLSSSGKYNLTMIASSDFGLDTLEYVDYIEVIPSTDPMVLQSVRADTKIYLQYGRDVFDPSTCPTTAFSLMVKNEGTDYPVAVSSLALNKDDPSIIELTLNAEIYNTDEIVISYDDAIGNLKSADDMVISSFTDEVVTFNRKDIFTTIGDGTVESSTNANWAYAWWGGVWGMYNQNANVSTARPYEGSQSLYFDILPEGGGALNYKDNAGTALNVLSLEAGKVYEASMMVYIEEMGNAATGDGFNPSVLWMRTDTWATLIGTEFNGSEVIGEWYKSTFIYTSDATEDIAFIIRLYNASSTVSHKVYIDNIKFEELDSRP